MEAPFSSFIGWPRAHHTPRLQLNVQRPLLMHVPPSQQQRQQENLFTVPPPFTPFTARLPTTLPQSMDVSSQQSMDASQTTSTSYNYSRQNAGKEKTPMCRIAELARYNRIKHEYNLLDESGPAHQKVFSVSLVLKEGEVYTGKGASIKKAQQDAAAVAWESTKLPKPPQRATQRRPRGNPISFIIL
uniref:DRBM domain-containing protein n=1 Tax=Plectus sambesii TaxID=2011161 RepID=A0A914WKL4_9BILA